MHVSKIENLQTAEKSRGWLEFWRFSDQKDRSDPSCFMKKFSNERKVPEKFEKLSNFFREILKVDIADVINY